MLKAKDYSLRLDFVLDEIIRKLEYYTTLKQHIIDGAFIPKE